MFKSTKLFGVPVPFFGTFEEVNLRFYVKRKDGTEWKRGVVFINDTVPHKAVALMDNRLYKEHHNAIPTSHSGKTTNENTQICCPNCGSISIIKYGKTLANKPRFRCKDCEKTFLG